MRGFVPHIPLKIKKMTNIKSGEGCKIKKTSDLRVFDCFYVFGAIFKLVLTGDDFLYYLYMFGIFLHRFKICLFIFGIFSHF